LQSTENALQTVAVEVIEPKIYLIRGNRVMLDRDLAELYGVKAIALRQQVKRNRDRFPGDFHFQLTVEEADLQVSQFVIPSRQSLGGSLPYAFTEQGVAMLSSVLTSKRAIEVNIAIMRTFVRMRGMISSHQELFQKITEMETKYDDNFQVVFDAIRKLMEPPQLPSRKRIGFGQTEASTVQRSTF
jgi:hypothetical protein